PPLQLGRVEVFRNLEREGFLVAGAQADQLRREAGEQVALVFAQDAVPAMLVQNHALDVVILFVRVIVLVVLVVSIVLVGTVISVVVFVSVVVLAAFLVFDFVFFVVLN